MLSYCYHYSLLKMVMIATVIIVNVTGIISNISRITLLLFLLLFLLLLAVGATDIAIIVGSGLLFVVISYSARLLVEF